MRPLVRAVGAVPVLGLLLVAGSGIPATATGSTRSAMGVSIPLSAEPDGGEPTPPTGITAGAWLVADADSGAILAAHNADHRDLPASTMKILTALTVLPGLPPDREVVVSDDAARVDGTRVGLVPGVSYTVQDLATAMIIASGNDAAVALVEAAGGRESVLRRMNAKAKALGAYDTVAGDPSGLDAPGQVTTVHDLAVLGRAALRDPTVRGYLTIPRASLPGRGDEHFEIANHNSLLGSYEGAIGVKNGYTVAAAATFVGAATRGDRTLIVALLRTAPAYGVDARALLNWGFTHAHAVQPVGWLAEPANGEPANGDRPRHPTAPEEGAHAADGPAAGREVARAGEATSQRGEIGPVTWAALGLTIAASIVTVLRRHYRTGPLRPAPTRPPASARSARSARSHPSPRVLRTRTPVGPARRGGRSDRTSRPHLFVLPPVDPDAADPDAADPDAVTTADR